MDVFGDLLARNRRSGRPALRTADGRERSYRELLTNAYKAGNALRHRGLRRGACIDVAPVSTLQPILAFFGASLLGATIRFDAEPAGGNGDTDTPRVRFIPVADEERYDPAPETKLVVFGGEPADPATTHWEAEMWSENPAFPPTEVTPDDPLLSSGNDTWSHRSVLDAARTVAEEYDLDEDDVVVLRGSLSEPEIVTAGVVAPLLVGGTIALADESVSDSQETGSVSDSRETGSVSDSRGTLAVCADDAETPPEPQRLSPADVPL